MKSSASSLYNSLSVLRIAPRCLNCFTVVHANVVNMVSASWDGLNYSHRQLQSKEGNVATSSSLIMQAALCVLPSRDLLVLTSQKGIQMYESDGSIMVYWHALDTPETPTGQSTLQCLYKYSKCVLPIFFFTSFNYGELGFDYYVPVRHCLLNVPAKVVFARGIAAVREKYICVGVSSGSVLVFDVPSKGSNIILSEVLEEHKEAITDMASECSGVHC